MNCEILLFCGVAQNGYSQR